MCGRFTLTAPPEALARHFELADTPVLAPRFNIAPGQDVVSIRLADPGKRMLELRRWGLVPGWAPDPSMGARCINARSETAAQRAAFRRAFRQSRCLLPADGFYEWGRGSGLPYHVALPGSGLFAMAGLWEDWRGADGARIASCTILTTAASPRLESIHGRMPVILDPAHYEAWLDPGLSDPEQLAELLQGGPGETLVPRRVSRRVNDVGSDDAHLLDPAPETPEPAQLGLDL